MGSVKPFTAVPAAKNQTFWQWRYPNACAKRFVKDWSICNGF